MTATNYHDLFNRYAAASERSLSGRVEVETILGFFTETVLALGVNGTLVPAKIEEFADKLRDLYAFYKAIGTRAMAVERVEIELLYENHDRARVFYRAEYLKKDGTSLTIPFDVCYLLQRRADGPRIFAFIAGDESALYRKHGLVDADGKPA